MIDYQSEEYLESLFAQADNYLDDNPYLDIEESQSFHTKVVGVTMENRQEVIKKLSPNTSIHLKREPGNPYDPNAIMVMTEKGEQVGYLKRKLALVLAPLLDQGQEYKAYIASITGGVDGNNYGLNILITKEGLVQESIDSLTRARLEKLNGGALFEEIKNCIIGEYSFHEKQLDAINSILEGDNSLVIMGTGRGKSAIFQSVASYLAITEKKVTIIVYPLRALSNDQYYSMNRIFSKLGLRIYRANGSLSAEERMIFFEAAARDEVDIVLTTPEFLQYNAPRLRNLIKRIGLFVIDESHHVGLDSHRPAYKKIDQLRKLLGNPQVLAVTATADDDTAKEIVKKLDINEVVIDNHVRENLSIIDSRGIKEKEQYVLDVVKQGKSIVYVGTRKDTVRLANIIRDTVPGFKNKVAFYHGKMTSTDRGNVEEMFRSGYLQCVVATSAFGEGINVPDVSDVVLYHMVYSFTEFNQESGRGGRNGQDARIHVLFGKSDGVINTSIIKNQAPSREQLTEIYKALKVLPATATNNEIAEKVKVLSKGKVKANETLVSYALGILEELGLINRETYGNKREIEIIKNPPKCDLSDSLRYEEGIRELEEFEKFKKEILTWHKDALEDFIKKPIYPKGNVLHKCMPKKCEVYYL